MKYSNGVEIREGDILMVQGCFKEQVMIIVDSEEEMEGWGVDEPGCFVTSTDLPKVVMTFQSFKLLESVKDTVFLERSDILPIYQDIYREWHGDA